MDLDVNWKTIVDIDEEIDSRVALNDTSKQRESLLSNSIRYSPTTQIDDPNPNRLGKKFEKYANLMKEELTQAINGIGIDRTRKTSKLSNPKKINPQILLMVFYCLQPTIRSKISVFNYDKNEKLSETILRTICKCKSSIDFPFVIISRSSIVFISCGYENC